MGPGGANHSFAIYGYDDGLPITTIQFQKGPRKENDSIRGIIDTDLLEIVRYRLQQFQNGPFKSDYNAEALKSIEDVLTWLNKRVEDRANRNVLGTNKK